MSTVYIQFMLANTCIAFPNILHAIEARDAEASVMIVDFEKCQVYQEILLHNKPDTPILRSGEYDPFVLNLLDQMIRLIKRKSAYSQEILAGYANALLGELLNCVHLIERSTDSSLLQQLILHILQNYTKPITLDSISKDLGYSRYHISRSVASLFGCNLRALINSYRISLAQNLLINSNKSIGNIAIDCGFKNQSSFNRIFLEHSGVTPHTYRQQIHDRPDKPEVYLKE